MKRVEIYKRQSLELYKKYRPQVWEDVIGHETVVESLKKAIIDDKIPTAFLFSGGHGCGKTTAAFILSKALNCINRPKGDPNPCNDCYNCREIDSGNGELLGISYKSMANNGNIDDVRKIMEQSQIARPAKRPVIILDEVHNVVRPVA